MIKIKTWMDDTKFPSWMMTGASSVVPLARRFEMNLDSVFKRTGSRAMDKAKLILTEAHLVLLHHVP